jgi:hypothetical protein
MASREIKLLVYAFRWAEGIREQGAEKDIWARLQGSGEVYIMRSFMISTHQKIIFD